MDLNKNKPFMHSDVFTMLALDLGEFHFNDKSCLASLVICEHNEVLHQLMEMVGILVYIYVKKQRFLSPQ